MLGALTFILTVAVIATCLWALIIRMPGRSYTGRFEALSAEEQVTLRRLEKDVRKLAEEIGERNVGQPAALEAAAQYIEQVFESLGFDVVSQRYESFGHTVRNIEASRKGANRPDEIVLIGGHYDSVLGTVGANDNATGAAAVLELARLLAGERLARTLRLVAFVNEEPPHFNLGEMGSQHYARAAAARGDRIVAMLSLETIGYYPDAPGSQRYPFPFNLFYPSTGNFIGFIGNIASGRLVRRCLDVFRRTTRFPSEGAAAPAWVPGVSWSDHGSFWPYGTPAIMVTDTALYRYPYYHTPEDKPEHVQYARMARVVTGLAQVTRALAEEGVE